MEDIILLKLGELVLKGLNRRIFETKLIANIKRAISPFGEFKIYSSQSIIYVEPIGGCDMDAAYAAVKKVFGIALVSRAAFCPKDENAIFETAVKYLGDRLSRAKSFKVESKRSDKRFHMNSIELSQYVGGLLNDKFPHVAVDVHNPEIIIKAEVRELSAYVHGPDEEGAGGLPVGVNGRMVSLLSGGIDSPVSTYMIAKRGAAVLPVHFFSHPYTSELAKEKVLTLTKILSEYCGKMTVRVVPFTRIQEEIKEKCPEELFTVIMRRFMMRIAEIIAQKTGCSAIVTGENLGQVASQTIQAMAVTEECVSMPVLRPVIALDKKEIIEIARKIDTFETSILPYEDCCTIFTPRHPKTKPRLDDVVKAESALDVEALVDEAVSNIEWVKING